MAISPAQFKAFAGKKKGDEPEDDDAEHEAAESEEFEAGEIEGAAEGLDEDEEVEAAEGDDDEASEGDEGEQEVNVQEIGDKVQEGKGDKKLLKLAADLTDEDKEIPPPWAVDADIWDHAVAACEDFMDEYDLPMAVIVHVYDAMGGEID